ncbi:hypothetical protein [Chitinophaga filiformis]|uniref:Uncharacterized protein n=1 Tax=Chitinophaga filiformis TaxID=104663 RepID=A0A1G7XMP7_CHIFI|nr:hypothetical protein [Chitinophaga filiformis]SDG85499.1 hypothetical protein SAMN04488121_1075 [Chitinophaga filiformis]
MASTPPPNKWLVLLAWITFLLAFCPLICCLYVGNNKAFEIYLPVGLTVIVFLIQQTGKRFNASMFFFSQLAIIALSCYVSVAVLKPFDRDMSLLYNLKKDFTTAHNNYCSQLNYQYIVNEKELDDVRKTVQNGHEHIIDSLMKAERSGMGMWDNNYRSALDSLSAVLSNKYTTALKNNYICVRINEVIQRRDLGLLRQLFDQCGFTSNTEMVSIKENDEIGRNHGKLKDFLEGMIIIGTHGGIWKFQRVIEIIPDVESNKILKIKFLVE